MTGNTMYLRKNQPFATKIIKKKNIKKEENQRRRKFREQVFR